MLPRMAWALGDPAGIGPELVAKGLVDRELMALCRPVVVGPAWLLARGARVAGVQLTTAVTPPGRIDAVPCDVIPVVDDGWPEQPFPPGVLSGEGGKLSMEMLRVAFDLTKKGVTAAVVYGPLNKEAMSKGGSPYKDELRLFGDWLGDTDRGEINAAAGLFTTRVTSHVPLKEVPGLIQPDRILKAIRLLHKTLV
ncbi:MAG TPA: 4-hydroxythreonine-4-phosphate dehydrogenase PdxA, partial [Candidatus Sulfotelmatobacter sp.]|nr:4-hydroxythreonine-4-phosphate dehydrogenase PdxA [Candidatus Sulfotelmatobacter sp.]